MARHLSGLVAALALLVPCLLVGIGPVAAGQVPQSPASSNVEQAAAGALVADAVVASASVRVKVDPHAARTQSVHKIDFADYAPNPLSVSDASSVASAQASGAYEAHITPSSEGLAIVATGHLDGLGKRTANGGQDPESTASAALEVHVSATGDIPYTLRATLHASGHAPACAVVSMRLVGDTVAEDLKAEGPSTARDPGCNNTTPGLVDVTTTGVVHATGDLAFRFNAVLNVIDPGSVRTDRLHADWNIVLTLQPPSCSLKGIVVDGAATDGHQNPLEGIRVQLWRDGNPVGEPVATDATGTYCIRSEPGVTDPGDYKLRATLIDAIDDPPLFETRFATENEATFQETSVSQVDFGGPDKDIQFTSSGDTFRDPASIANIHYQSERFVSWVIDKLGVSPATIGPFTIVTYDASGDSTRYNPTSHTVYILAKDSPYSERNTALSNGSENDEWHEISHHVAHALGIAPTDTSPACAGRTNHAGWQNPSTCDSLSEGFAMFLPTLASLDIDASTGPGFGTPEYAGFGSLEANEFVPWTMVTINGTTFGREDLAVAQLLWDLADDTPDEHDSIDSLDPANPVDHFFLGNDTVALAGIPLVHLLAATKPQTVADIYAALQASSSVPALRKAKTVDISGDGKPDVSPLEEVFLLHDFHPVHDATDPGYTLTDPVSRTDHLPDATGGLVARPDTPLTPGSAIRFVNSSSSPETFSLDVTYPSTTSDFPIVVAANSSTLVHFEVPPYWRQILAPGAALPDCGAKDQRLVMLRLSGPGGLSQTLDSCEYLHDVVKAIDGAALSYGGSLAPAPTTPDATTPPVATVAAGVPIGVVLGFAAVVLAVLGMAGLWVRRRRRQMV
jgi:hypothetical protein